MQPLIRTAGDSATVALAEKPARWCPPFVRGYAALIGTMVLARAALALTGAGPVIASQALVLSWPSLLVIALLGFGALFLAARAGFSAQWAASGPAFRWHALAALLGVAYGLLTVSGDVRSFAQSGGDPHTLAVWGTVDIHQPTAHGPLEDDHHAGSLVFVRLHGEPGRVVRLGDAQRADCFGTQRSAVCARVLAHRHEGYPGLNPAQGKRSRK